MKKKLVILGAGESGTGAAVLGLKQGFEVFVSDKGPIKDKYKDVLSQYEINFEEGKHSIERILDADEVVKSPGIPDTVALIGQLQELKIPVISEIEFAARYTNAKLICITGSNGKTTTTLLTWHILNKAGLNVGLAGNVGQSFALQVAEKDFDFYVLEISSFQLDGMFGFKADVAILLNITPDHLDRYEYSFQKYADSKLRIVRNQTRSDFLVYNYDDPVIKLELEKRKPIQELIPFSIEHKIKNKGAFLEGNNLIINTQPNLITMTLEQLALQGKHNIYDSMAAGVAASLLGIRKKVILESLSDFKNVAHRLEYVARIHGVEFINDSKATNVNSTWFALESMNTPVIWIAGGIDKGNDYSILKDLVAKKVKAIICVGKDNTKLAEAFGDVLDDIFETTSIDDAVKYSLALGKRDETVLLSPACASFDLFEDYEDRGNRFKKAVSEL
ncbi:MAG: UDP-N-acetylmuramoyl-L-alanine--D-glutamate ligase [Chlorobi bacterium]|nr:UDP-N-acetylmuramoyl-L-alanine--D-glutamate ligase [Chlorobiota bacterium]